MTTQTEIRLKISARYQANEFVTHARLLASDLEHAAKQVEGWLEGDFATLPAINSLGEVQSSGPMLDVRAAKLCATVEALEMLKAEDRSSPQHSKGG